MGNLPIFGDLAVIFHSGVQAYITLNGENHRKKQ